MSTKLLFLGSGGSMGVPVIGCKCGVCSSNDSKNKRLRPSVLLKINEKSFLVDIGPDYRLQGLKYQIDKLDGLLLTHSHYDHIAGLDELRSYIFKQGHSIPCLLSRETLEEIKICYHYFLLSHKKDETDIKNLKLQILKGESGVIEFEGIVIGYFSYKQVGMKVTGFRFNNLAYVTDIMEYKEEIFKSLKGIEVLILSARKWKQSVAHLSLKEAIEFSKKTDAKRTYINHISHEMDHHKVSKELPKGFMLAYDGLEINF